MTMYIFLFYYDWLNYDVLVMCDNDYLTSFNLIQNYLHEERILHVCIFSSRHCHSIIYKQGCTRLAAASDRIYQLLAYGWWLSPCTPASSTTKTGRHDIAEILLKVALSTKNLIKKIILLSDYYPLFQPEYNRVIID